MRKSESPVRTCVGCRSKTLASQLVRVTISEASAVVDGKKRSPGRGAWIHNDDRCLLKAQKSRAFDRAIRYRGVDLSRLQNSFNN